MQKGSVLKAVIAEIHRRAQIDVFEVFTVFVHPMVGRQRPHLRSQLVQLAAGKHIVDNEVRKGLRSLVRMAKALGSVRKGNLVLQDRHNPTKVIVVVSHTPSTLLGSSAKDILMDKRFK